MPLDLIAELEALVDGFARRGVAYALCGGRHVQRVSKLDPSSGAMMSLDVLVVAWRGRDISIVSRSGLATMKRLAGRPQDLADLAVLEGTDDGEPA